MVGGGAGGNRRDEGSLVVNNTNVFAVLESLRKKKSDKERGSSRKNGSSKAPAKEPEQPRVFWAPAPLTVKSWADVDDEDDDDYYATTAPPQSVWGTSQPEPAKGKPAPAEESEIEDLLDEGDDDVEDEHENELALPEQPESVVTKTVEVSVAPREAERQLSKKERKKKELAELEALLADMGVNPKDNNAQDAKQREKDGHPNGDTKRKENAAADSKNIKKKKKKDKPSKETKEPQDQANGLDGNNGSGETAGIELAGEDSYAVDVKERIKKMASAKKKKSNKEMDAAARAAAVEAAARSAKLAAAKKNEKNHYNQQPVR